MILSRFIIVALAICAIPGCGGAATPAAKSPGFSIGINVGGLNWWNRGRVYANLILGNQWQVALPGSKGWVDLPADMMDANGWIKSMPAGSTAFRSLNWPRFTDGDTEITCRYVGRARLTLVNSPAVGPVTWGRGTMRFRWRTSGRSAGAIENIYLRVENIDDSDPIRNIDCRETAMDPAIRFDPAFVASLKGYGTVRMGGWQNVNENPTIGWDNRKTVANASAITADGMPLEDMVALANLGRVDPWFTLPWNADDRYQREFARYVHQNLARDRVAYVEMSNEVWNMGFSVARQSYQEGLAKNLSTNAFETLLRRYAERTTELMRIWTEVYADRPASIVRVAATQHVSIWTTSTVLDFGETARFVDAVATAPYFGYGNARQYDGKSVDQIFDELPGKIEETMVFARKQRAVAARYGKRYIAYEAGQHIVLPDDVAKLAALNRDPRMGALYTQYLDGWRREMGDLITLLSDAGPIGRYGAWGLREYMGQPLSDAPKARAVDAYLTGLNKGAR